MNVYKNPTCFSRWSVGAFNANKKGPISIVSEGGKNREYIIPADFKCILSVKTANTQDYRQNLTHTYSNVYIDMSQIANIKGQLHIDLPKEYIGMFIGKSGSHIKRVISELQQVNPNITNIKIHEKELPLKEPAFLNTAVPECILKDEVIKDYFNKYATEEEKEKYVSLINDMANSIKNNNEIASDIKARKMQLEESILKKDRSTQSR